MKMSALQIQIGECYLSQGHARCSKICPAESNRLSDINKNCNLPDYYVNLGVHVTTVGCTRLPVHTEVAKKVALQPLMKL